MTLKEKFYNEIKYMERAEICEQIADDYAIEFYCWMIKVEEGTIINKEYANQLLTDFKKEKGL
jgi:hypothetical protein